MQTDLDALIRRARESDGVAAEELFALLYDELHRLAEHTLHRDGGHSPSGQPPCCTRLTSSWPGATVWLSTIGRASSPMRPGPCARS